jgi:peptidoglycan/LPS O-acetylase OafA/YrhL
MQAVPVLKPTRMDVRIRPLDTLRGAAILMVMVGHYLPTILPDGAVAWNVTSLGRGGVILFFLLSGYLIFWNVERQSPAIFLSRRAFKIFPAYWASAFAIFAIGYVIGPQWSIGELVSNLMMTQDVFGKPLLTGVYWTLLIEVKFYVLVVLQYYFLRDKGTVAIPLVMIGVNLVILLTRGHASLLLTYLPAFYVGIQIRRLQCNRSISDTALKMTTFTVAASMIFFDPYYGWWSCFYVLAWTLALHFAIDSNASNPVVEFFGRISYSDYLYHAAILAVCIHLIGERPLLVVLAAFAASTLAAFMSYRLIEVPFVEIGKSHEQFWLRRMNSKETKDVAIP